MIILGMVCSKEVMDAIEGLYAAFSVYPLPKYTDPCLHCHSLEDEEKLREQPLRELDLEHLREYAVDALTTWGDIATFKHFLPRIFELYMSVPDPFLELIDPEIIFSKFRHGDWRAWPYAEQDAVESFLHAVWLGVLSDPPIDGGWVDVECWLCSIAQCEDNLNSYLREWIADERLSASYALSSLLLRSVVARVDATGRNPFWDGRDAQYVQLQQWARSSSVVEKLRAAELSCGDSHLANEFAAARAVCEQREQENQV